jgi:hypothetical protein
MRDDSTKSTGTGSSSYTMRPGGGGGGTPSGDKPGWFALRFGLDHANRELRVCMTRAVAGVSVAGFCGLLIGVIAVSRSASNNGPQSAHASPSVIEPAARDNLPRVAPPKSTPAKPRPAQVHTTAKPLVMTAVPIKTPAAPAPALATAHPRATPTTSVTPDSLNKDSGVPGTPVAPVAPKPVEDRTVGHNYLVFGSYPTAREAKRVTQKLQGEGINCTIERGLPGWTKKSWYSVVGVKGYETTKNAEYEREVKSLENLGLDPRAYRWRAGSTRV